MTLGGGRHPAEVEAESFCFRGGQGRTDEFRIDVSSVRLDAPIVVSRDRNR